MIISVLFPKSTDASVWINRAKNRAQIECIAPDVAATPASLAQRWNNAASKASGRFLLIACPEFIPPVEWDRKLLESFQDTPRYASVILSVTGVNGRTETTLAVTSALRDARGFVLDPRVSDSDALAEAEIRSNVDSDVVRISPTSGFKLTKLPTRSVHSAAPGLSYRELWPFLDIYENSRSHPGPLSHLADRVLKLARHFTSITELGVADGEMTLALLHGLSNSTVRLQTYAEDSAHQLASLHQANRHLDWNLEFIQSTRLPDVSFGDVVIVNLDFNLFHLGDTLDVIHPVTKHLIVIAHSALYAANTPNGTRGFDSIISAFTTSCPEWQVSERSMTGSGYTVLAKETSLKGLKNLTPRRNDYTGRGPLVNVVTRTCNRPNFFKRMRASVEAQTYHSVRHIVVHQEHGDLSYITPTSGEAESRFPLHPVLGNVPALVTSYQGPQLNHPNFWPAPYNLLSNVGMDASECGWITFLDDDDILRDDESIYRLSKHLIDEDTLIIHRFTFTNGITIPPDETFRSKSINLNQIGTGCFTFHSKWKSYARWDMFKCADFRFVVQLASVIPKIHWLDQSLITMSPPGLGKKVDFKPSESSIHIDC